MTTITISMPEAMRQYVEKIVESGGFGNVSEYFRSLVREDAKKREQEKLEQLLLEGLTSEGRTMTHEDLKALKTELLERTAKARAAHKKKAS